MRYRGIIFIDKSSSNSGDFMENCSSCSYLSLDLYIFQSNNHGADQCNCLLPYVNVVSDGSDSIRLLLHRSKCSYHILQVHWWGPAIYPTFRRSNVCYHWQAVFIFTDSWTDLIYRRFSAALIGKYSEFCTLGNLFPPQSGRKSGWSGWYKNCVWPVRGKTVPLGCSVMIDNQLEVVGYE